ncbi:MAG TPA: hypothetical protein VEP90_19815, partial [Methylomirabilota bacterium]|nr:hypothetical protein [Methylomirabilota bacterium]
HPELDRQLYHIYADRFYVLLKGMPLEPAQEKARSLIEQLRRPYRVDALRVSLDQPVRTASLLVLNDITARLGVLSFTFTKLADLLERYSTGSSVIEVREIITLQLENSLEKGKDEGGNVVITWNPQIRGFERLPTQKEFE